MTTDTGLAGQLESSSLATDLDGVLATLGEADDMGNDAHPRWSLATTSTRDLLMAVRGMVQAVREKDLGIAKSALRQSFTYMANIAKAFGERSIYKAVQVKVVGAMPEPIDVQAEGVGGIAPRTVAGWAESVDDVRVELLSMRDKVKADQDLAGALKEAVVHLSDALQAIKTVEKGMSR